MLEVRIILSDTSELLVNWDADKACLSNVQWVLFNCGIEIEILSYLPKQA